MDGHAAEKTSGLGPATCAHSTNGSHVVLTGTCVGLGLGKAPISEAAGQLCSQGSPQWGPRVPAGQQGAQEGVAVLSQCCLKCGPRTGGITFRWELAEMQSLRPCLALPRQSACTKVPSTPCTHSRSRRRPRPRSSAATAAPTLLLGGHFPGALSSFPPLPPHRNPSPC